MCALEFAIVSGARGSSSRVYDFIEDSICLQTPETAEDLLALIDGAGGGENLGICLDTGHLHIERNGWSVTQSGPRGCRDDCVQGRYAGRQLRYGNG